MSENLVNKGELQAQFRAAVENIHPYNFTVYLPDGRAASGVLVNTQGYDGILTAYHVAKPLMEFEKFAVSITNYPHSVWVDTAHLEHIPIGTMSDDPSKGPDLSFIIVRDKKLLGTLRSKKSFAFLESQAVSIFNLPLDRLAWGIAGSPDKYKQISEDKLNIGLHDFAGMAIFEGREERDGFDYLKLRMPCDGIQYPSDFAGLSGGGMWAITFKGTTPDKNPKYAIALPPVLAGISFYQSEPKDGWRVVTGHGFDSIYSRVRQALKPRRGD